MTTIDKRVREAEVPDYEIRHAGTRQIFNVMFSRGDMSFYGFSSRDVTPPPGCALSFDTPDKEPVFVNEETGEEVYHGPLRRY